MAGIEQRSKAEIIGAYRPQMTALLDEGAAVWELTQRAQQDHGLYRRRDRDLADFLTDRQMLTEQMGMSFIPLETVIQTHPFEIPMGTPPENYADFLHPYSKNHLRVKMNLGPSRGGLVQMNVRVDDVRNSKGKVADREQLVLDSLDAAKKLNVVGRIETPDLSFLTRTVFEMIAVNNDRFQKRGLAREELEKLGDKLARERLLRFERERRLPPEVILSTLEEDNGLQRLIVTIQGVGDREFVYNPKSAATL